MLTEKLERLVDAYERHGVDVRSNLAPGATDAEIDAVRRRTGLELPADFVELYRWHNGHIEHELANTLQFRDNTFLGLRDGRAQQVIDIYQQGQANRGIEADPVDLLRCLPIAEFSGAVLVVPGVGLSRSLLSPNPVVSVFQGIDVYFLSIESMVDTCIEWVEQPDWNRFTEAPNERQIWAEHNPGVFGW